MNIHHKIKYVNYYIMYISSSCLGISCSKCDWYQKFSDGLLFVISFQRFYFTSNHHISFYLLYFRFSTPFTIIPNYPWCHPML